MTPLNLRFLLDELSAQPVGVGLFLAGAGIVFLMLGHRIFRALIAISFGAVGYVLGATLAHSLLTQILLGFLGGLALAIVAVYYIRAAVAILTGFWCAMIVLQLGGPFHVNPVVLYSLAAVVFCAAISLTFIMYEEITAFITSLEGSLLCTCALLILVSRSPSMWPHVRELMATNWLFAPFVVMTGTVTGFYFQLADLRHKNTGAGL